MIRKAVVLVFMAMLAVAPNVVHAQTNYPADAVIEVRDANGNLLFRGRVGDPMNIYTTGWTGVVTITFLSDPILLGTATANPSGEIRATYPIPNVPLGNHTLRLQGTSRANGQARTVDWPVEVIAGDPAGGPNNGGGGSNNAAGGGAGGTASNVLGSATDNASGGSGVFGKTGADQILELAAIGFAALAVGAALTLAVRRSQQSAGT